MATYREFSQLSELQKDAMKRELRKSPVPETLETAKHRLTALDKLQPKEYIGCPELNHPECTLNGKEKK